MKKLVLITRLALVLMMMCWSQARAEFSFFLIDNFESGLAEGWYNFGNTQVSVEALAIIGSASKDAVAESGGEFTLKLKGMASNWYAGGLGKVLFVDASPYSRLQFDIQGSNRPGKIKIELFTDTARGELPKKEDKFIAEVPVLGPGISRFSIPFSAFRPEEPTPPNTAWTADQKDGSQGLTKIQFILLTNQPSGEVEAAIDNIVLTY